MTIGVTGNRPYAGSVSRKYGLTWDGSNATDVILGVGLARAGGGVKLGKSRVRNFLHPRPLPPLETRLSFRALPLRWWKLLLDICL